MKAIKMADGNFAVPITCRQEYDEHLQLGHNIEFTGCADMKGNPDTYGMASLDGGWITMRPTEKYLKLEGKPHRLLRAVLPGPAKLGFVAHLMRHLFA